jgi:hypothetical protein
MLFHQISTLKEFTLESCCNAKHQSQELPHINKWMQIPTLIKKTIILQDQYFCEASFNQKVQWCS